MGLLPRRPLILVALCLSVSAIGAGALTMSKPPAPVIATVDLAAAISGLDKRKEKESELEKKLGEFKTDLERRVKDYETKGKQYETMPAGPAKKQLGQELAREQIQLKFDADYAQQFLDQMKGELMRELYDDITTACRELAARNSYTMVLADDSKASIMGRGFDAVMRGITLKRTLYVDPAHDVTKELVDMMNNQFNAGGKAP